VCILAGGLGTRLGNLVADTPKPLLEVAGQPFVLHQLRLLERRGADHVVLCVGYLGQRIEEKIGSERFGIRIDYSYDAEGLEGTLGAIRRALSLLSDRFLVLYGDTYLSLDYGAAARAWQESGLLGLMTVLRNEGQWEQSNVEYAAGRVTAYDKRNLQPERCWIDYGLGGLDQQALQLVPRGERDLATLYARLAEIGELYGYPVRERFYEIGTPESLAETDAFLRG
jgi:NDP-sugar pyrophosphorylase family protein